MKNVSIFLLSSFLVLMSCNSRSDDDSTIDMIDSTDTTDDDSTSDDSPVVNVDESLFLTSNGSVTISTIPCTLSDGTSTDCYQIVATSVPADHEMGPW